MAINAYTGLMGSGKSYEVVSQVITEAIAKGRRVVTNVDSIDSDKVREYVAAKRKMTDEQIEKMGHIVHCKNSDVEFDNFFPHGKPEVETFCKPGDLICIDEAWRFFGNGKKIPENHQIFFREHRHYTHPETGVSCDLVLMVQDIGDLNRFLKSVVELSFRTVKLKAVGRPKNYRVETYEGSRHNKRSLIQTQIRAYDPKVFPLYSSYVGGKGLELVVDKRGSIFSSPVWIVAPIIGLIVVFISVFFIYKFFSRGQHLESNDQVFSQSSKSVQPSSPSSSSSVPSSSSSKHSSSYRLVGRFQYPEGVYLLVKNGEGALEVFPVSASRRIGPVEFIEVDGKMVSVYTGSVGSSTNLMAPPSAPRPSSTPSSTQ